MSFRQPRNFDKIKSMSFEEMEEFLAQTTNEDSPWIKWFDGNHCANCAPIIKDNSEFSYCELNDDCRLCTGPATDKNIVRLWLDTPL